MIDNCEVISGTKTCTGEALEYHVMVYLGEMRRRIRDIDALQWRIDDLENRAAGLKGVQYKPDPANPNVNADSILNCLAQLEEVQMRLGEEIALNLCEINQAWELCRPKISEERHILWLHYVQGMPWKKIAYALHVSDSTLFRMRRIGIEELYDAMPEEWRRDDAHKAAS